MDTSKGDLVIDWLVGLSNDRWITCSSIRIDKDVWNIYIDESDGYFYLGIDILNEETIQIHYTKYPVSSVALNKYFAKQREVENYIQDIILSKIINHGTF